jgi:hypothetical protein
MHKNKDKRIRAIFSDYDGTLCSASATRDTIFPKGFRYRCHIEAGILYTARKFKKI